MIIVQSSVVWGDAIPNINCSVFDNMEDAKRFYAGEKEKLVRNFKKMFNCERVDIFCPEEYLIVKNNSPVCCIDYKDKVRFEIWNEEKTDLFNAILRMTERITNSTTDGLAYNFPGTSV